MHFFETWGTDDARRNIKSSEFFEPEVGRYVNKIILLIFVHTNLVCPVSAKTGKSQEISVEIFFEKILGTYSR